MFLFGEFVVLVRKMLGDGEDFVPGDVQEEVDAAMAELVPRKSQKIYEQEYSRFKNWMAEKGMTNASEKAVLAYIRTRGEAAKPSSLWAYY